MQDVNILIKNMNLTNAIIAGIATILSAAFTIIISEYLDQRKYKKVKKEVREAINGKWKGIIQQTLNDNLQVFDADITFKVLSSGAITGIAKVPNPINNEMFFLDLKGGFYSEWFIKIDYESANKAILQFGTFIFRLSYDAARLEGYFNGHGHISGKIIAGPAYFEKV